MEVMNDLLDYNNLKIYQNTDMFNFSLDSVLLSNFVTVNKKINNILDIGCGNAVIPLILSTKTDSNIVGVEIQKDVVELAIKSVKYNNLTKQIKIINDDINNYAKNKDSEIFDVITCNPPFFKISENSNLNDNVYKTIARHELKLNLSDVMKVSKKLLKNNGHLAIVHRPDRLIDIILLMKENGIEPKKIRLVYPGHKKNANILLIEGVKNGNPGLKILEPLYTHKQNGEYTKQIQKYFKD